MALSGYEISRNFFNWTFENPELIQPGHIAIFFFAVDQCNRKGWKDKFYFPSDKAMEAVGIKKHQTYTKYLQDLIDFGFIKMVQKSTNQFTANIISINFAMPKSGKALDKATEKQGQSTGQSKGSKIKQVNFETIKQDEPDSASPPKVETQEEKIFNSLQVWIAENAKRVNDLKEPFTKEQFTKLLKSYNNEQIKDILEKMHNSADLLKKYVSAYKTAKNWLERNYKNPYTVSNGLFSQQSTSAPLKSY